MQPSDQKHTPVLLYLHIPKTAGMAFSQCVFELYRSRDWREYGRLLKCGVYYYPAGTEAQAFVSEKTKRTLSRNDLRAVVGHFSFGVHEWIRKPVDYVTLLRHPVDRVISLYHHIKNWEHEALHDEVVSQNLSVSEFVRNLKFTELDNGQTRRIAGAQPPFGTCDRDLLEQAQRNLASRFAVVGLTERFAESVALMKNRLRWPALPKLRRVNVNPLRPSRATLSAEALKAIVDANRLDLELYAFAERQLCRQIEAVTDTFADDFAMVSQSLQDGVQTGR